MKRILLLPVLLLMITPAASAAAKTDIDEKTKAAIDRAVVGAIELRMTPGAVVAAGRADGIVFLKAYGKHTYDDNATKVTSDTIFDLASLTKPIAGATSVMVLIDEQKLSVTDPVSRHIEGMRLEDKKEITIEQLLLHRAGFIADNPLKDFMDGPEKSFERIYSAKLRYEPGKGFEYSDNSFLVLGKLVEEVARQPLDRFAKEKIFAPLKMTSTTYNPPAAWKERIAPTEKRDGKWAQGEVHDPRAHALGGVAGHAGLFGTAGDVARFCRMLLNKGELEGVRVLSEPTVAEMTRPRCLTDPKDGKTKYCRGYGLDIDTRFSSGPRGERFEKERTFGHTGYTGTSFWIDPHNDAFVILLTNRVHPDDDADIKMLRKRIATLVADALLPPKDMRERGPTE